MPILWRLLNVLGWVGVLVVNGLANTGGLYGRTTGEVSDKVQTLVTPAGYAFSIWGLIYLLLLVFIIVPFLPSQRHNPVLKAIGPWFFISCLFNIGWLLVWHSLHYTASVFVMAGLLLTLIKLYLDTRPAAAASGNASYRSLNRWFVAVPFSLYLGWISVATIVNVASALQAANWGGWGLSDTAWAVAVLVIAGLLGITVAVRHVDPVYPLVIAWALIAIGIKQQSVSHTVAITAWTIAFIAFVLALIVLPRTTQRLTLHRT